MSDCKAMYLKKIEDLIDEMAQVEDERDRYKAKLERIAGLVRCSPVRMHQLTLIIQETEEFKGPENKPSSETGSKTED